MIDIPIHDTFDKVELINKGMSGDKKYHIETVDGSHLLLRLADISEYEQKKAEFSIMQQIAALGVPMSNPIDFGVCNDGKSIYTLLGWIEGYEIESILPTLTEKEQYILGIKAGKILRKIHTAPMPNGLDDWSTRYFSVMDQRFDTFRLEGVSFEGDDIILNYLEKNRHLLKDVPQCRLHGDYHMGNLIQSKDGQLFIIDWHTVDFENYGDPWYEFNRIGIDIPAFATGQIDGYFDNDPPERFWSLFAYYLAASAITSIVWSKYFAPNMLESILSLNTNILRWFDDMKNTIPTWYIKDLHKNYES